MSRGIGLPELLGLTLLLAVVFGPRRSTEIGCKVSKRLRGIENSIRTRERGAEPVSNGQHLPAD